ncbi:MAG: hypothetical protein ACOCZW_00535 [Bacteroidota bacterium]
MRKYTILSIVILLALGISLNAQGLLEGTTQVVAEASKQQQEEEEGSRKRKLGGSKEKKQEEVKTEQAEEEGVRKKTLGSGRKNDDKQKEATTQAAAGDVITGRVVSFNSMALGSEGFVSKEQAEELVGRGAPLAFKVGQKIYWVYNADGSYAGEKLANFAGLNRVGIIGKIKSNLGLNFLIASKIESME